MNKTFVTIALIIGFVSATFGQKVNGINLKTIDV